MFSGLVQRFFGKQQAAAAPEPDRIAWTTDLPAIARGLPKGMMACVVRDDLMVDICREHPPQKVVEGDVCWLVPAGDIAVPVTIELGGKLIALDASVRFEPDTSLGALLSGRECLFGEDIEALVSSELGGLFDLLGQKNADDLLDLDNGSRERLRAKLSLLLQARGMRCTGLEHIRPAPEIEEPAPEAAQALAPGSPAQEGIPVAVGPLEEPVSTREDIVVDAAVFTEEPVAAPGPARDKPAGDQVQRELAEAVGQVQSDDDWDALLGELEAAGFQIDEAGAVELDELGDQVVGKQISAEETAARIRRMADEASRRSGVSRPDLRRWQGLALRLRVSESPAPARPAPTAPVSLSRVDLQARRRPWTWWFFRSRSVDERLRTFLSQTVQETQAALDQYRLGLRDLRLAAKLRGVDEQFKYIRDLLATVPTLVPGYRSLRPDRRKVKELVRSVESAVTAAEMIQAQVKVLLAAEPASAVWDEAFEHTRTAADALADHLRARRAVR